MDRRQSLLGQLILNDQHQLFHSVVVVAPIADDLQTMGQVAKCVREVTLQLQSGAVTVNSLWNVAGVFVDAGQIAVRVGKRWIDLE